MERNLTKTEIIKLFYGDLSKVLEPDYQWQTDAQVLGLNPEHYIIERSSNEIVNIYELYLEILFSESDALKSSLAMTKKKVFGTDKHEFIIAPKEYQCFGNPKDKSEIHYFTKLVKTEWANINSYELSRVFAQGDSRQPLKTEEMIYMYLEQGQLSPIDEDTVNMINSANISIEEWQRAMVLKDLLYLQKSLSEEVKNHQEVFLTDVMPKKFMYGQTIIYNPNKKAYSVNGKWIDASKI